MTWEWPRLGLTPVCLGPDQESRQGTAGTRCLSTVEAAICVGLGAVALNSQRCPVVKDLSPGCWLDSSVFLRAPFAKAIMCHWLPFLLSLAHRLRHCDSRAWPALSSVSSSIRLAWPPCNMAPPDCWVSCIVDGFLPSGGLGRSKMLSLWTCLNVPECPFLPFCY